MSGRALVLAAHGSRRDPAANALVRRLAESHRGRRLFDEVAVAFHQGEPGFDSVLDELAADEVTVVPFLTSARPLIAPPRAAPDRSSAARGRSPTSARHGGP
jgi:cobalamin biosynthesis Co2+ chelatase CbiK